MQITPNTPTDNAFEIVSFKFNDDVSLDAQKHFMENLNSVVANYEGFKSRNYFYSADNGRWIDVVVWSDEKLAKQASQHAMKDPAIGEIFSKMDEKSMIFSHYNYIGGIGG